jgi:hypothetical protein
LEPELRSTRVSTFHGALRVSAPVWTLEQAAELFMEQMLGLLDGCDADDSVRPALVFEAMRQAWSPETEVEPLDCTAGELRKRLLVARKALADGDLIP